MSRAERFAFAGALLLVLVHGLVVAFAPAGEALEYARAALFSTPWRLVSGHWVHINWPHVLINAAAWFVVARVFAPELSPARQATVVAVASVVISAGLAWRYPQIAWYRGFSGVLHALFFAGATAWVIDVLRARRSRGTTRPWLPLALFVGGWVKVVLEQPGDGTTPIAAWLNAPTVPQAHLIGALCGTALGAVFAVAAWRGSAAPALARDEREQAE